MISDHPAAYAGEPAFEFIKRVPTTWDETRVLGGEPGRHITIARRRGQEWFLGSLTNWDERDLEIRLSFLGDGKYVAEIYRDAPDAGLHPKQTVIEQQKVDRSSALKLHLASGGGAALRLRPE